MNKYVDDIVYCVSAAKKVAGLFAFVKILCNNTIQYNTIQYNTIQYNTIM